MNATVHRVAATRPEREAPTATVARKLRFVPDAAFLPELKRRVQADFARRGVSSHASPRMVGKSVAMFLWFAASYAGLVFLAATWWQGGLLAISLALAMAGLGFAVQHDANHGAYSSRKGINRAVGFTLDLIGGSSYLWRVKHNVMHHTYTNVPGADDDIDITPLARLAPTQPRRRFHRFQHFYIWALYGLLVIGWHFVFDFKKLARGEIAGHRFARPRGWDLALLLGGKALFFGWALVVPALFHPWWVVGLYYLAVAFLLGLVLSVVFQLAHCVEEAGFPTPRPGTLDLPDTWAVHQAQTTVDFARGNRLLTWYVGGLNFQIEHHLFPRVCHIHYPRIAGIVEATCAEHGVRYAAQESLTGAVASHWRWLRRMGAPAAGEVTRGDV